MVGRVSAFQTGGPGSIPSGVRNFNFYLGTGCVLYVQSCVFSGGGHDIVLSTLSRRLTLVYLPSVLVHSLLLPLQASDPREFGL